MSYLIDTHTLLWYLKGDEQLSKNAKGILDNKKEQVFISIASLWEMAIKINIEKLKLDYSFPELEQKLQFEQVAVLGVLFSHTETLTSLPLHHRDPFDRMIIAQSLTENLTIISKDKNFSLYPIQLLW